MAALALVMFAGPGAASASPGASCTPQTGATYRYDRTTFRFLFAIHLCDDRASISYGADGLRETRGFGTGASVDGIASCTNRVCTVTFGFEHGREAARYRGDVFWGDVAVDVLGPIYCVTTATVSACRPPPDAS